MATRRATRHSLRKRELSESNKVAEENQIVCADDLDDKLNNNSDAKTMMDEDVLMYDSDNKENEIAKPEEQARKTANESSGVGLPADCFADESNSSIAISEDSCKGSAGNILTDSILAEEEACLKENEIEAKKIQTEAVNEFKSLEQQQRFARLQHLLACSNIYAQFLLERMQKQREEGSKETKKQEIKQQSSGESQDSKGDSSSSGTSSPARRSKRKRVESRYLVEDYVTEEALKKQVKKRKQNEKENKDNQVVPSSSSPEEIALEPADSFSRLINGKKVSDRQPGLFSGGVLRPYQLDGMEWMKGLFENGINGILGDEMGLGKTVQVIALLAFLIEKGIQGPFLIVAPLSTLPNWVNEFERFTPEVYSVLYHGSKEERMRLRRRLKVKKGDKHRSFPVVITSYQIILSDKNILANFKWKYIVVDEAQRLKNMNCKLIQELKQFQTANRLLLSGTPLQNDLSELWSLLNFLLPDIFDDLSSFQAWFDFNAISEEGGDEKIVAQEQEEHVLETLHSILTPFLLRRLKSDVELELPPKREVLVYAQMTAAQRTMYKECLDKTIVNRLKTKEDNAEEEVQEVVDVDQSLRRSRRRSKGKAYKVNVDEQESSAEAYYEQICRRKADMEAEKQRQQEEKEQKKKNPESDLHIRTTNILMMLRHCCNHPYLIDFPLDQSTGDCRIDEGLVENSGKMKLLDQMLPKLQAGDHKVLIFSQSTTMLNIIGFYLEMRNFKYSRLDGSMSFSDRASEIKTFNGDPSVLCFLLSTRAGGLGLNLMAADTAIIYDSDWNPQCDLQAQDRCHRIGQTKPVVIYRFLLKNSIDETMVEVANRKRKLEKMVIHKDRFKGKEAAKALSQAELLSLLQSSNYTTAVDSNDTSKPLSDEALEQLLDRSDMLGNKIKASTSAHNNDLFKVVQSKESLNSFNTK